MHPVPAPYHARLQIEPCGEIDRWRPFVHWFLAIPHWILLEVFQAVAQVCAFFAWVAIVFTGRAPQPFLGLIEMYLRYQVRTATYALFLRPEYPPFEFSTDSGDSGRATGVRFEVNARIENRNRATVGLRLLLMIPNAIVLGIVMLGAACAVGIGAFAVLFTGRWPEGLRSFVIGAMRWSMRLSTYGYLLVDDYPPFALDTADDA